MVVTPSSSLHAPDASTSVVEIELDGKAHCVPAGSHLGDLVAALGHAEQSVATAVNQGFIPRSQRALTVLRQGDQVMLFQPIVGG